MAGGRERNIGLGIDWNFANLDGLINNRATDVIHEVALRCTCDNEDTYAGQIQQTHVPRRRTTFHCDICRGDGWIFRNPVRIIGMITNISENKQRVEGGWLQPGDCILSTKIRYRVNPGDLITFLHEQPIPDSQVIVRGAGSTSGNTAREIGLEEDEDRLWYAATSAVWCEDEEGNTYQDGADFTLDGSKIIKWSGSTPHKGRKYTIKYNGHLEWVAFLPPQVRVDRNRDLGQRVMLRKRHVHLINEDPRPRVGDKIPFCSRINCV